MTDLVVREYGAGTSTVMTLHGGPGAAGDLAPLARELAKRWRVLEPFQRGSGAGRLTVATHVQDLDEVIRARCGGQRPILVGHSWGAMLALAYAASHPGTASALVLIGCGTFTAAARAEFKARLHARLTPADREELTRIEETIGDEDQRYAARGRLMMRVYACDVEDAPSEYEAVDALGHDETWTDMLRLQREGVYPAAFAAIRVPVLMIHGEVDPHPGTTIRDDLRTCIPHLEYVELAECGHSPWLERRARQRFYEVIDSWMRAVQVQRITERP
jgi:pimeloyl-ACP methyl ester carboxylesterase